MTTENETLISISPGLIAVCFMFGTAEEVIKEELEIIIAWEKSLLSLSLCLSVSLTAFTSFVASRFPPLHVFLSTVLYQL